jgi:hypothetical protein
MTVVHEPGSPPVADDPPAGPFAGPPWAGLRRGIGDRKAAAGRRGRRGHGGGGGAGGERRHRGRPGARPPARDRVDMRNTWQVVAGSVLVPLGVVFILMAWYGAAHTSYVQQQVPYLVSGSFVGLGCMVLGGLLYWAHWLYRIYDQADLHHEEHLEVLQALMTVAARTNASAVGAVDGAGTAVGGAGDVAGAEGVTVVRTGGGRYYHDPACPVVRNRAERAHPLSPGETDGLAPCRICRPPDPGDLAV